MQRKEKQAVAAALEKAFGLANELKKLDREYYGAIFAWINRSIRAGVPVPQICRVVEIAHSRATGYGQRPRELHQYLNGIRRSLDGEQAAAELRAGQKNSISDILGRAMAAAMEEKTNGKR